MAPHSSTLAWKIPWMEGPGGLQSIGSLRVGHDWPTSLSLFTFMHWRMKWQPTPVFLPGESQGRGAWWAAVYGVTQSRTRLKRLSSSNRAKLRSLPGAKLSHRWGFLYPSSSSCPQVQKTNTPEQVLMCLGHVFKSLNHSTSFLTLSMMTQEDYFSSYVSPIILCTHCGCISHLVAWYCYITNEP